MEQVIFGGGKYDALDSGFNRYNSLVGAVTWGGLGWYIKVVSTSGKIKNLRVKLDDSPGDGKSYTFTLMVNGAPTALTLEIADAATSGADTTHEVDVVAGDTVSLYCEPTNTPAERYAYWTSMFDGATAKESLILGGTESSLHKTDTEYAQVMGADTDPSTTENDHREVCPTSGKIKNLYVELNIDPGTSPSAYKFTLRKGGVSQTLTVTITADDKTGNDTAHEVTVAAGDVLTMMIEPLETPSVAPKASWGMTFVADTDGESVILAGTDSDLSTIFPKWVPLQCDDTNAWYSPEIHTTPNLGQSCTLKKLYLLLSVAPGDGKSYTLTSRIALADGNLTVTITGAVATTGNDVAHTDAIADDDYVNLECTSANTPTAADAYWGLVGYIAPAPPPVGVMPWNLAPRVAMMGA